MGNEKLKEKVNQQAQQVQSNTQVVKSPANTIAEYLKKMGPEIARALPKHMDADRLARIALTTIRTTPKLLNCKIESLMGAVMQAAQLGLEPGLIGHCYIIPFGQEATFMIGYKGMIDLARRSGNIQSIAVREVYENDFFKLEYGLHEKLEHVPWYIREDKKFDEPGEFKGAYLVARFVDGGHYISYMSKEEIDRHRKRSKASGDGPWVTDYTEMAKKTVIRANWKYLPISIEIMRQVETSDETVKTEIAPDMTDVLDVSYVSLEAMGGNVTPDQPPAEEKKEEKPDGQSQEQVPPEQGQNDGAQINILEGQQPG